MADIVFKFDHSDFDRAAKLFPRELYQEEKKAMTRAGIKFRGRVDKEQLHGPAAEHMRRRTGFMAKSLKNTVTGSDLDTLRMVTYFDTKIAPYAPFHEGPGFAVVTPKRAKWLAVPTKEALTASGVIRSQYAAGKGLSLRTVPGMFLVKKYMPGSKAIAWMGLAIKRSGKKGGIKLIYIFKKSVSYRRKLRFGDSFTEQASKDGDIYKEIEDGMERAAKRFNERK